MITMLWFFYGDDQCVNHGDVICPRCLDFTQEHIDNVFGFMDAEYNRGRSSSMNDVITTSTTDYAVFYIKTKDTTTFSSFSQ